MADEGATAREAVAEDFDRAADELAAAADHLRTAARHFRAGEVPRGCAHAFAAQGNVSTASARIDAAAVRHAARAQR